MFSADLLAPQLARFVVRAVAILASGYELSPVRLRRVLLNATTEVGPSISSLRLPNATVKSVMVSPLKMEVLLLSWESAHDVN